MGALTPMPQAGSGGRRVSGALLLPALALLVAFSFIVCMLMTTEVHFVPQVADLYLVCQYARAMAEGHPFRFNPGEAPSMGATSLLHTATLALAHFVGVRGEGLVAFAILLGAAFLVASVLLARRVATRLAGKGEGWLAGLLVAFSGPTVWGFLSGSDVGLFMLLALWLLDGLIVAFGGGRSRSALTAATLLALARPEGLPIGVITGAALSLGPFRGARSTRRLLPWLPAATGFGVLALNRLVTGAWLGTSVSAKSLLANYGLAHTVARVADYGVDVVRGILLGLYPSQVRIGSAQGWAPFYFPPLALGFVLVAVATAGVHRRALSAWLVMVAAVFALMSPNTYMGVHFNRYLMWAFPGLLVLTAVGIGAAARLASARPDAARSLFRAGASLAGLLACLSTARFATLYGEGAGRVYLQEVATAEWISRSLPAEARLASLVTSIEYLTGRRGFSLNGIANPALAGNRASESEADTFEALGRIPPESRPTHLLTSDAGQEAYPFLRELVEGPPLFRTTSLSPDEFLVFRMRWDALGPSRHLYVPEVKDAVRPLREMDALNVCDVSDEVAHGYAFRSELGGQLLTGAVHDDVYSSAASTTPERVLDGGRMILGEERFRIRATAGKDLLIVMRTVAAMEVNVLRSEAGGKARLEVLEPVLSVELNGVPAGRFGFRVGPGWSERAIRVPGSLVTRERSELRLSGRYASFYYWIYQ
jgi:hypothetical protein